MAERRDDLAGLVDNLATTTGAIGREKAALSDAIGELPPFMRRANTTFVNLRATLDDLDPLVDESKPVAKQLGRSSPSCARWPATRARRCATSRASSAAPARATT